MCKRLLRKSVSTLYHEILIEKLDMHCVSVKLVPCLLINDQKENHVNMSQELLDRVNTDKNFIKTSIPENETLVYSYVVKAMAQSSQQFGKM